MIVKDAVEAPASTVTVAGGDANVALLVPMVTTRPPAGAFPFNVSVAETELPPTTGFGVKAIDIGMAGVIVSVAVRVTPLAEAVIVEVVEADTP